MTAHTSSPITTPFYASLLDLCSGNGQLVSPLCATAIQSLPSILHTRANRQPIKQKRKKRTKESATTTTHAPWMPICSRSHTHVSSSFWRVDRFASPTTRPNSTRGPPTHSTTMLALRSPPHLSPLPASLASSALPPGSRAPSTPTDTARKESHPQNARREVGTWFPPPTETSTRFAKPSSFFFVFFFL